MAKTAPTPESEPQPVPMPDGETESIDSDDLAVPEDIAARSAIDTVENLDDYALSQDFSLDETEETPPVIISKPPKDDYFRVHPDPGMTQTVGIYETSDGECYIVKKAVRPVFGDLVAPRQIFVCVTSRGKRFLWPAKLPRLNLDGSSRRDRYSQTAIQAAEKAKTRWTRMYSDQQLKLYRWKHPADQIPEPDWSKDPRTLIELINAAFGDGYVIANMAHPEARRLRSRV
jgi:hypothetical protein